MAARSRSARKRVKVELSDLTGFDGRCDALFFTTDMEFVPPKDPDEKMAAWRRRLLGLPEVPPSAGQFDVVVVGGGIAGCSAALTAARLGLQVAFIQNRPVLGGNASPEIGITVRGQNRSVVSEVAGPEREKVIRAEKNIHLYLGWHAFRAQMKGNRIESVDAKNTATNKELRFAAPVFIDCTGTGSVGFPGRCGVPTGPRGEVRVQREPRPGECRQAAPRQHRRLLAPAWPTVPLRSQTCLGPQRCPRTTPTSEAKSPTTTTTKAG